MRLSLFSRLGWALCGLMLCVAARADSARHSLWELHGKHNTVYLLGSIHVLRLKDYPLAPAVLAAYGNAKSVLMEVNLEEMDSEAVQAEMLASAILPEGRSLPDVLGPQRYGRAAALAREVGVELSTFDQFAPWFAAEAVSQLQLTQLGFQPESRRGNVFHGAGARRREKRGGPRNRPRSDLALPEHAAGHAGRIPRVESRTGA